MDISPDSVHVDELMKQKDMMLNMSAAQISNTFYTLLHEFVKKLDLMYGNKTGTFKKMTILIENASQLDVFYKMREMFNEHELAIENKDEALFSKFKMFQDIDFAGLWSITDKMSRISVWLYLQKISGFYTQFNALEQMMDSKEGMLRILNMGKAACSTLMNNGTDIKSALGSMYPN